MNEHAIADALDGKVDWRTANTRSVLDRVVFHDGTVLRFTVNEGEGDYTVSGRTHKEDR